MKRKIIPIIALLAVMVGMTGVASAANSFYATNIDHVKVDPIYVKNGDDFTLALQIETLNQFDLGHDSPNTIVRNACLPTPCQISDIAVTILIDPIPVLTDPTIIDNQVRIAVNVPLNRKAGTAYPVQSNTELSFSGTLQHTVAIILTGGEISGKKCNDLNGDGICGQAEPGLAGWTIILKDVNGTEVNRTTTDANGNYSFRGPTDAQGTFLGFRGTFTVEEVLQAGWIQTGPPAPGTYTVIIDANDATGLDFANNQTVGRPGKSIGWGDLGSSASFDYWIYSKFLPSGTMKFTDKINNVEIKATRIDSIDTTCNELTCETWPKSGTIKGMADVTENGVIKGNFAFTVKVEDKADPSHGQDTFSISVPNYKPSFMPSGYSMSGDVTFGNLKVIKTS